MPILHTYSKADFDRHHASGAWNRETFAEALADAAKKHPEKIALVHGERRVSYGELARLVDALAAGLMSAGIGRQDVVSVQLPNSVELVATVLALSKIEAVYNPLNPGYRRHEVEGVTSLVRPKALFCKQEYRGFCYPELIDDVAGRVDSIQTKVVVGEPKDVTWTTFDSLVRHGQTALDHQVVSFARSDPDAVFLLGSTSGTTGNPKIYIHTANTQLQEARGVNALLNVTGQDVLLAMAPMTHRGALMFGLFTSIAAGSTLVVLEAYSAEGVLDLFEKERISCFMAIPTQVIDLLGLYEKQKRDVSSLRLALLSGAPVGEALVGRLSKLWPGCTPITGYGTSETGYSTLTRPGDSKEKLTTSGRAALGMEIETRGEDGRPTPAGKVGEIFLRGPFVCAGYFGNQRATSEAISPEGWFRTGDLGFLDQDGYLHPVGRLKHVIIRGGLKIHAEEIEFLLSQHPAVAGAIVTALPDERLGERACACLVFHDGASLGLAALRAFLEEKGVAKFQWPEFVLPFEAFPLNPVGKLDRRAIAQEARKRAAA